MKKIILHFIMIITSIIGTIICFLPIQPVSWGYELIWLHPLVFGLVYVIIIIPTIETQTFKITVAFVIALSWLRLVATPFLSSLTGIYNGVSYINVSQNSIQISIMIVVYEFIISSAFLYLITKTHAKKEHKFYSPTQTLKLKGNKIVYALFLVVALILYLVIGRQMNLLEFFIISVDTSERFGDVQSTTLVLLRQIFKAAMIFLFVWFVSYCERKYRQTGDKSYILFSLALAILNVGIIIGERRSEQVYVCLVVMFILTIAFKEYRKQIILLITIATSIVLVFMSIYKHSAAYYYGSYSNAIQASPFDLQMITQVLQAYFFGSQNVAAAIEFSKSSDLSFINLLYDFSRSVFGLSFVLKDKMIMTTEYFNSFLYGFSKAGGHVISGAGYGYIYFGFVLSPIITCLNIFISTRLEKWFNNSTSYEMKYIVGYMLVRFATNIYVNTPPLISLATIMLFSTGLVYFIAKIMRNNKRLLYI